MLTLCFDFDAYHRLLPTKVFKIFDLLAAQDNQLRNLIEDTISLILLDMAIGPSHSRSRRRRRIPATS